MTKPLNQVMCVALCSFTGAEGSLRKGMQFYTSFMRSQELEQRGLAQILHKPAESIPTDEPKTKSPEEETPKEKKPKRRRRRVKGDN